MTQENKDLLLKDLCARLPYGVKVLCLRDFNHTWYNLEMIDIGDNEVYLTTNEPYTNRYVEIEEVKPYLFPLSSMTEEQKYTCPIGVGNLETFIEKESWAYLELSFDSILRFIDWLNKNHFDYRNLIDKNLAIDATNLNIY